MLSGISFKEKHSGPTVRRGSPYPAFRGMKRFFYILCRLGPWLLSPLMAQVPADSAHSSNILNNDFLKQNTSWIWQQRYAGQGQSATGWQWHYRDQFRSQVFDGFGAEKTWKDENRFSAVLEKIRSPLYSLGMYARQWIQADRQPSVSNTFANYAAGARARFTPRPEISITPYVGYQNSRNNKLLEWGWDTGLELNVADYRLGNYTTRLRGKADYDFYDTRRSFANGASVRFFTRFNKLTADSLSLSWSESVKQFYSANGRDLLNVELFNRRVQNHLMYNLNPSNRLDFITRINSRHINYFVSRDIFLIENLIRYNYFGANIPIMLEFKTSDETIDNTGLRTDSQSLQSGLSLKSYWDIDPKQKLLLDVNYNKLQYDTPDSLFNHDDRDEIRFAANVRYSYTLSDLLSVEVRLYGYLFRQIYIFREQSINNNWNRVLKLQPRIVYKNGRLRNSFSTAVRADYTDFDFDALNLRPHSFLFREYTVTDSLNVPLTPTISLAARGRIELEEKGNFFAREFAQNIIQSYRVSYWSLSLRKTLWYYFTVQAGYSYYERREWRYFPARRLNRVIENSGPFISATYLHSRRLSWTAYASINRYTDSARGASQNTTGYLRFNYTL